MKSLLFLLVLVPGLTFAKTFSFHVKEEPSRLHPYYLDRMTGHYVLTNMFKGYLRIDKDLNIKSGLAKKCLWKNSKHLICTMGKNKWSGGKLIALEDYISSMKYHKKNLPLSTVTQALISVKEDGIQLKKPNQIHFHFKKADADFLYRLASPAFSPIPENIKDQSEIATEYATGPYKLKTWSRGRHLLLERNLQYPIKINNPPLVKVVFVPEENTALSLYIKGKLSLLRRLPAEAVKVYKDKPEFSHFEGLRFDYFGFGTDLKDKPELRKTLTESVNYKQFSKLFFATIPPGCFGLPPQFSSFKKCYEFKPKKLDSADSYKYKFFYTDIGGENLRRSIVWFHNQWKKHAGINFRLEQEDYRMLGVRIRKDPPPIFRRGIPLDRPTCLAALESFETDSPDNFIRFSDKSYDKVVHRLRTEPKLSKSGKKKLCTQGLQLLFKARLLIPLGSFIIPILKPKNFKGWTINGLNQLDLSYLEAGVPK